MSKRKFVDLDSDQYERTQDELSAHAHFHGLGMWDKPGAIQAEDLEDIYGICNSCSYFFYCRREFGEPIAICRKFDEDIRLRANSRMVECRGHEGRQMLSLAQMMDMATIIDTGERKAGFLERK